MNKKIIAGFVLGLITLSCNNASDKGKFAVSGEIKNATDQRVYLEKIFFVQQPPEVLDTAEMKNGKFELSGMAPEEGLFHIRLEDGGEGYLFINDKSKISLSADAVTPAVSNQVFNSAANNSLKKIIMQADSMQKKIGEKYNALIDLKKNNVPATDSAFIALNTAFENMKRSYAQFCFQYADTAKSPVVALFAVTIAPVEMDQLEPPLSALSNRFPQHGSVARVLATVREALAATNNSQGPVNIGTVAPEITMNDPNGKPFSLSQLRGKYVLIDFWASWCGPCRSENPNVVDTYHQFKDKNFTILGVSLDTDNPEWLKAINQDKLSWQQISDLKGWHSAAVPLYGLNGIPFNILIDPDGKVIGGNLRGGQLQSKLSQLLK